jgi:hypothetical protein
MPSPRHDFTDALLEQRLAELDDDEFDRLVARTRPPRPPSQKPPDEEATAAAVRSFMTKGR